MNEFKDFKQKKTWLFGLTMDCPYQKSLELCAIKQLRSTVNIHQKLRDIEDLNEQQVDTLIDNHRCCSKKYMLN